MLCQNCQSRVANVHFTQIINDKKTEVYLCEQCAKDNTQFNIPSPANFGSFFTGMLGSNWIPVKKTQTQQPLACSKCGMTFEEFISEGKLGCPQCYSAFSERLSTILRRVHGSVRHSGKAPSCKLNTQESDKAGTIQKRISGEAHAASDGNNEPEVNGLAQKLGLLQKELETAIKNEEYEKAAQIRDVIRAINQSQK